MPWVRELRATHIDLLLEREDLSDEAKENIAYENALAFLGGPGGLAWRSTESCSP